MYCRVSTVVCASASPCEWFRPPPQRISAQPPRQPPGADTGGCGGGCRAPMGESGEGHPHCPISLCCRFLTLLPLLLAASCWMSPGRAPGRRAPARLCSCTTATADVMRCSRCTGKAAEPRSTTLARSVSTLSMTRLDRVAAIYDKIGSCRCKVLGGLHPNCDTRPVPAAL